MKLTKDEFHFLATQKIAMSQIFDASGLRNPDAHKAAKENGCNFVFGLSPCRKHGHRLRTRNAKCIQCDTAQIGFQLRGSVKGATVYVAASHKEQLFKVGISDFVERRLKVIQTAKYGGADDWEIVFLINGKSPALIEYQIQRELEEHCVESFYYWNGRTQNCLELFSFNYDYIKIKSILVCENMDSKLRVYSNEERLKTIYNHIK